MGMESRRVGSIGVGWHVGGQHGECEGGKHKGGQHGSVSVGRDGCGGGVGVGQHGVLAMSHVAV